uniref:Uncharacterized protein n=1 Tax=Leersia perrieri TaxID=77586 RepID=A0A0D9VVD6_9ORYZ
MRNFGQGNTKGSPTTEDPSPPIPNIVGAPARQAIVVPGRLVVIHCSRRCVQSSEPSSPSRSSSSPPVAVVVFTAVAVPSSPPVAAAASGPHRQLSSGVCSCSPGQYRPSCRSALASARSGRVRSVAALILSGKVSPPSPLLACRPSVTIHHHSSSSILKSCLLVPDAAAAALILVGNAAARRGVFVDLLLLYSALVCCRSK